MLMETKADSEIFCTFNQNNNVDLFQKMFKEL